MSNRIFTSPREVQGRNANIAANMSKRNPIFNHQSDKQELSPFLGYNCNTSENIFSTSQVSEFSTERNSALDSATIRKLIKEEIEKHCFLEEQNKKQIYTAQAQINDLKEKFADFEKKSAKISQEKSSILKQEMVNLVQKLTNQNSSEITLNLRKVFEKTSAQFKKQFAPIAIIEEMQQIYEKLQLVEDKIVSKSNFQNNSNEKAPSAVSQHVQSKVNKLQRQLQTAKKSIKQLEDGIDKIKSVKQELSDSNEFIGLQKERTKKLEIQLASIQKKISFFDLELNNNKTDINLLREKVQDLQKNSDEHKFIIKDLHKKYSSFQSKEGESIKGEITQFLRGGDNIDTSIILNNSSSLNLNSKPALEGSGDSKDSSILTANEQSKNRDIEEPNMLKKSLYQIDKEGYLMDEEGKYLLTETNTMLKLSQEQIQLLSEADLIEFN